MLQNGFKKKHSQGSWSEYGSETFFYVGSRSGSGINSFRSTTLINTSNSDELKKLTLNQCSGTIQFLYESGYSGPYTDFMNPALYPKPAYIYKKHHFFNARHYRHSFHLVQPNILVTKAGKYAYIRLHTSIWWQNSASNRSGSSQNINRSGSGKSIDEGSKRFRNTAFNTISWWRPFFFQHAGDLHTVVKSIDTKRYVQ